jgi:hypothetical protein
MTNEEKQIVTAALNNLVEKIYQLEPDPEYMEMYGVEETIAQAQAALCILNKKGE